MWDGTERQRGQGASESTKPTTKKVSHRERPVAVRSTA